MGDVVAVQDAGLLDRVKEVLVGTCALGLVEVLAVGALPRGRVVDQGKLAQTPIGGAQNRASGVGHILAVELAGQVGVVEQSGGLAGALGG